MGCGFVVARFGLFLQQVQLLQHAPAAQSYGLSLSFGTALIAAGVIVNVFSGWHHLQLVRELDRGETEHSRPSRQAVAVAFSGIGWAGNGDLSGFGEKFRAYTV
jgi:putative membrane protein